MVAQDNEYMTSAVKSMYRSNEDHNVIKIAREREEFLRSQAYKNRKLASQTEENASLSNEIVSLTNENASLSSENASLSNENISLAEEISRLRRLLEDNGIRTDS